MAAAVAARRSHTLKEERRREEAATRRGVGNDATGVEPSVTGSRAAGPREPRREEKRDPVKGMEGGREEE